MKRYTNRCLRLIVSCILAIGFMVRAHGQITGGIRGTVSDQTGAAVVKAIVTLTNVDTKQPRTQSVNDAGEFTFELLTLGHYEVKTEAPGFATSTTQAEVKAGEYAFVTFKLEVGQVTQTVEVSMSISRV